MTEVKFTKQRVEDYHSHNYFGCEPDTSVEEQEEIKRVWIDNMKNRGWILDESVIYHDPGFGLSEIDDNCLNFERDGQLALEEAIQYLGGAF
jgi:hypothetical protein